MSLVEKALERMHQERARAAQDAGTPVIGGSQPATFGRVVTASPPRPTPESRAPQPDPRRVVEVNEPALRAAGLLPPEHQARLLGRQYRQIKRPLIANALGRGGTAVPNGHLVMVASAVPGEGKTFTSLNLAFSIAMEKDIHVLLADADVLKPHISRLFGVESQPGLLDVLEDPSRDIESVILPTSVRGLSLLPAGSRSDHATELLSSERMVEAVQRLGTNDAHRIVLFDSPPLLLTSESHSLTQVVGQIIVIVRAGKTPQQSVIDALSHLGEDKRVALVLNQSVTASPTNYYYYENNDGGSSADGNSIR